MNKLTLPNLLSGLRLLVAAPCAWFICQEVWLPAAVLFVAAVASDFLDGMAARRLGQVTVFGGLLDHASDALFVTATLAALAILGMVPLVLPALVIAAFTQYALDSRALAGRPLRASVLGRYNGLAYFVLAGFPIFQQALSLYVLPDSALLWAGWALVLTTLASMADRLIALLRLHRPR